MNLFPPLTDFYYAVAGDVRIGPFHISVYMALFQQWNLNSANPLLVFGTEIMEQVRLTPGILSIYLGITWMNMVTCVITSCKWLYWQQGIFIKLLK